MFPVYGMFGPFKILIGDLQVSASVLRKHEIPREKFLNT